MTGRKTLWLMIAVGIAVLAAAIMLLWGGSEEKTHEGARFVAAGRMS